jgi:8-oxo-dGTP diphosphatase
MDAVRRVVGAAIVRDGRVLAARRTAPSAAAGRWELPGGKVEPGESPEQALVREIDEELGCPIEVGQWLPGAVDIEGRFVLTVAIAAIADPVEPRPHEHDLVRWLGPDELDEVDWLDPDRPFLADLRDVLWGIQPDGAVSRHPE